MPIYLNGAANPLAINYNSTSLDAVYAVIGGYDPVYPVWEKDAAFPDSIGSTATVTYANGVTMYFRDMTLSNVTINQSDGKHRARYDGSVTLEVSFPKGIQAGASSTANDPITWHTYTSSITATSGIPSGYIFDGGGSEDSSSHTIAFDVYHSSDGVIRPEQRYTENLQSYISLSGSGIMSITTYMPGSNWPVYTRSTGWTYQGNGRLMLVHS